MKTSEALRKVLGILDHGNAWVKHHSIAMLPAGHNGYCISGASNFVLEHREVLGALAAFVPHMFVDGLDVDSTSRVIRFNDSVYTTWADIEIIFLKAIHAAEEQEARVVVAQAAVEQQPAEQQPELELVGV